MLSTTPSQQSWKTTSNIPAQSNAYKEAMRRDNIVRALYRTCPYKVGDTCFLPASAKKDYGTTAVVMHIAEQYIALGKDYEWKDDNPMIVYAKSDKGKFFFCTVSYLTKSVIQNET